MNAPQLIWLFLAAFTLGVGAVNHGKPRTGKRSFVSDLVGTALAAGLLYWGGFFGGAA